MENGARSFEEAKPSEPFPRLACGVTPTPTPRLSQRSRIAAFLLTRIQEYPYSTRLVRTVTASLLPFSRPGLEFDSTPAEKEATTAHGLTRSWSWAADSSRPCQQRVFLALSNPSLRVPE